MLSDVVVTIEGELNGASTIPGMRTSSAAAAVADEAASPDMSQNRWTTRRGAKEERGKRASAKNATICIRRGTQNVSSRNISAATPQMAEKKTHEDIEEETVVCLPRKESHLHRLSLF